MGPWNLETLKHGNIAQTRTRQLGDLRASADGTEGMAMDHLHLPVLQAVVGATETKKQKGEEKDCADYHEDLEAFQWRSHRNNRNRLQSGI